MPRISVLIPCYQAAETLPDALNSLAGQTFADFEIVAVDDGSTDDTPCILANWAKTEPRLRIVTIPHAGIIAALNCGLQACQADLVARMDADDRSHPGRLEAQFAFLQDHPEVHVLGCQVQPFPEKDVKKGLRLYLDWQNSLLTHADICREIFVESPLVHPGVMYRKSAVLAVGAYQDDGWPEDYDLWLRLYLGGAGFAKLAQTLLDWRERPGRLTRQDERYSPENFLRAKVHYLIEGPLRGRNAVIIWGAGSIGKHVGRALQAGRMPLRAYVDVDPRKIGRTRRGLPVLAPGDLPTFCKRFIRPLVLVAVGVRGARHLIRQQLHQLGFVEGLDWLAVA